MTRWTMIALLALGTALPCAAATMPENYVELIHHEEFAAVKALSDTEIAHAQADAERAPEHLCAALEQRARIHFFDVDQALATRIALLEHALQCRQGLAGQKDNAARVAWLQAQLGGLKRYRDAKNAGAQIAETGRNVEQYRATLGAADYAIAAFALGGAASASDEFATAYTWNHAGIVAISGGHDLWSRLILSRLLSAECYRLGRLGRFAEAEAAGKSAVELTGTLFGVPSGRHAYIVQQLGQVQYFAHHFADADVTLGRAVAEERQLGESARDDLSTGLMIWANLLGEIGDFDRGRAAMAEAIGLERGDTSSEHSGLAAMLSNLGLLEAESGHCDAALAPVREALQRIAQRSGADGEELTDPLTVLSQCELDAGQIENASADAIKALSIAVKTLGDGNPQIANEYTTMARVELAERKYAAATQRLQHALAVLPADQDTLGALRIQIERNLARSLHGEHKDDAAFTHAVAAETARQRLLQHFAAALDEAGGLDLRETHTGGLDQVLALAAGHHDPAWIERAWQLQIGSRSLITRLVAARLKAARSSADPQMQKLWEQWKDANAAYSAALLDAEAGNAKAHNNLMTSRDSLENAEKALARRIRGLGDASLPDIATLRASLPARSVLVGFALSRGDPWANDRAGVQQDSGQRYYAFRLDAGAPPALIDLGDAHEVGAAVRDWTASLRDPARSVADVDALGKDVARRVWQPLALASDLQHVFLVPEGDLHRVAWLALPLRDGPLVEKGPVPALLDSERDLIAAAPDNTTAQHILLVGAVPPDASIATGACGDALHALPGARRELDALRGLWNETGTGKAAWLVGGDANKAAVRAAMPQNTTIHFATHAFSDDSGCMHNLLAARSVHLVNSTSSANASAVSGLLLASNAHAAPADRDGLLTAPEIAAMRLDGVHTVTLAACDTGTGPVRADEGVFGLARAFRLAGARNVVMSLWNVDDAATADLMQRMYRARWVEHASAADALVTAARATLAARRAGGQSIHPYYWAAFVAAGDWR